MQPEHPAPSRNLRVVTTIYPDPLVNELAKPDTRRFAGIFPLDVTVTTSADCGDATDEEERDENSDDPLQWELATALDKSISTAQVISIATVDHCFALSAAQQVIAGYRSVHGNDNAPGSATTVVNEKELPHIPHDQRSMYTLATSTDAQSTMDMMWRPKPKVHMHHADQQTLSQAQSQAIEMMQNAGLKPTNRIQCRRRGCADILPDVEALKYHLHIHNIADAAAPRNNATSAPRKPSLAECSSSNSKSSLNMQRKHSVTRSPSRRPSAGSLFPSLFSPRESSPEAQHVPSIATVANTFVSDPNPSKLHSPLLVHNNHVAPSRGRQSRKESMTVSVGTECTPSVAMLLSPPSSPTMCGCLAPTPHVNSPILLVLNPVTSGENDGDVFISNENARLVSGKLKGLRNSARALSPTRAMSPIRDGIRRVLSIGRSDDFTDE